MPQTQQPSAHQQPPHRPVLTPGVHGYPHKKSVAAGEVVRIHLSSDAAHQASIYRLGELVENDSRDGLLHEFAPSPPSPQPIYPGSYVFVEKGLAPRESFKQFSVEAWVRIWGVGRRQTVVSQFDGDACGFAMFVEGDGRLSAYLGDGGAHQAKWLCRGPELGVQQWRHVIMNWDGARIALWVDGEAAGSWLHTEPFTPGAAPLRIGASGINGRADAFLDGDIAMPVLRARALSPKEIVERFKQKGLKPAADNSVLACWPLSEDSGDRIADVGEQRHDGRIINHGQWLIPGPSFDETKVSAFAGDQYDPKRDPTRGHALRLASDDLYDCGWPASYEFKIPNDAKSGIYVARVKYETDGTPLTYDITFVVTPNSAKKPAPLLVLCATNTWMAYATTPFAKNTPGPATWPRRAAGLENSCPEAPAYSSYVAHRAGQPAYYTGVRMPWPNAGPYAFYDPAGSGFGQWARLERHLHVWLDRNGYDYDIVADIDLHRDSTLLARHQAVILNGHSEYWSTQMLDGLESYLRDGGNVIVLSGNTMHSRVSFDDDCLIMEQRKTRLPHEARKSSGGPNGEQYHSHDGKCGGLLRFAGRSIFDLVGLETAGWAFATGEDFGVYKAMAPDHFLFRSPNRVNLKAGDAFGHAPGGGLPRAIGHEWDLTLRAIREMTHEKPLGFAFPPDTAGVEVLAQGIREKPGAMDAYLDYFAAPTTAVDGLTAEMIYWKRQAGGQVFHAGAIGFSWALPADPRLGLLLKNVLHHFGVPQKV